jgi:archaeal flagellar protein FlaJ
VSGRFARFTYRAFARQGAFLAARNPRLDLGLQRARILLRPEAYMAAALGWSLVLVAVTLLPAIALAALGASGALEVPARFYAFVVPAPIVLALLGYVLALLLPDLRALTRARGIDAKLPYAINYIATMAAAGATPEQVFTSLSRQRIYGEVAEEAAWIARDLKVLGADILTALGRATDRSPSMRFQDFIQGMVTTLSSGGDLKSYLVSKSEQYLYENRQDQKKFLEGLGVLAESFVTVVVAAPLFLIVILSVMTSFGGDAQDTLLIGYVLILVLIPLSQLGFAWTIKVMTPEA